MVNENCKMSQIGDFFFSKILAILTVATLGDATQIEFCRITQGWQGINVRF